MATSTQAVAQNSEPRLFNPPVKPEQPGESIIVDGASLQNQSKTLDKPLKKDGASSRQSDLVRLYRYDGFVSNATEKVYLVNGLPVSMQQTLELVAVSQEGAVIEIKTSNGQLLRIGIGQTAAERK